MVFAVQLVLAKRTACVGSAFSMLNRAADRLQANGRLL